MGAGETKVNNFRHHHIIVWRRASSSKRFGVQKLLKMIVKNLQMLPPKWRWLPFSSVGVSFWFISLRKLRKIFRRGMLWCALLKDLGRKRKGRQLGEFGAGRDTAEEPEIISDDSLSGSDLSGSEGDDIGEWEIKGTRPSIRKAHRHNPTHGKLVREVLESIVIHLINFIHLQIQQCVEVFFGGRRNNLFLNIHSNRTNVIQVDILALTWLHRIPPESKVNRVFTEPTIRAWTNSQALRCTHEHTLPASSNCWADEREALSWAQHWCKSLQISTLFSLNSQSQFDLTPRLFFFLLASLSPILTVAQSLHASI